jgi:hypothetical protein
MAIPLHDSDKYDMKVYPGDTVGILLFADVLGGMGPISAGTSASSNQWAGTSIGKGISNPFPKTPPQPIEQIIWWPYKSGESSDIIYTPSEWADIMLASPPIGGTLTSPDTIVFLPWIGLATVIASIVTVYVVAYRRKA